MLTHTSQKGVFKRYHFTMKTLRSKADPLRSQNTLEYIYYVSLL
jgi:hypothetical protein